MAVTVGTLRYWLSQFKEEELVGVDEGGLTLVIADAPEGRIDKQPWLEIGGLPEDLEA